MSTTLDPFSTEILTARTKLYEEEVEADCGRGAFSRRSRQTLASTSTQSSMSSSSKSTEFPSSESPFDSDTTPRTTAVVNKMRHKPTRKCFLIDSLLEERQKQLAAAAAAAAATALTLSASNATTSLETEIDATVEDNDKMESIDSAVQTSSNPNKSGDKEIEDDTSSIDNTCANFISADLASSSIGSSSVNSDKISEPSTGHPTNHLDLTYNLFTNTSEKTKFLLSQHKNAQQDADVDYMSCLRAFQNMMATAHSNVPYSLVDNPLLLLQIMNGAVSNGIGSTIAKQQQQQQQLLLHQQAAMALRSRIAALIAANSLHKESMANNRQAPAHHQINGKSKLFPATPMNDTGRTVSTLSLPCNVGQTRSSLPHRSSNAKKYRCDICEKTFSRSNTLITHKRIHTGEKPFHCEHCGRAFRQSGNLTRHAYTHTTVKPFVCADCGKAFNRASNLNTHMRVHTVDQTTGTNVTGFHVQNPVADIPSQLDRDQLSLLLKHTAAGAAGDVCASCGQQFANLLDLRTHQCQGV